MGDGDRRRNESIDFVRGLVMAIMVLDHCRDFIHGGFGHDPTNLTTTTPAIFATRWITHFCAPVFVFLAGTAAFLRGERGASRANQARFLLTRGLWLVLLELTVVRLGVTFNADLRFLGALQVIWAIGVSMMVLAGLVWLPVAVTGALGVAMVALHNLLDRFALPPGPPQGGLDSLWLVLHQQGPMMPFGRPGPLVLVLYPLVPWIGVMAAGYAFGLLYRWPAPRRRRALLALGAGLTAAFVVLRLVGGYGEPSPFAAQPTPLFSLLSFLNVTKYPPSLQFLCMTLGPAIALLGALDGRRAGRAGGVLVTLGRVPLFFYLLQWPLAHLAGIVVGALAGASLASYFTSPVDPSFRTVRTYGLPTVYLAWICCLLVLVPLCAWFARLKQRRRDWWMSYL